MGETVGESSHSSMTHISESKKPMEPSMRWKIANKLGIASFVASLGLLGASTTGYSPSEVAHNTAEATRDVASDFTKGVGNALERVDNNLDSHFPEPYKEPQEGK